MPVVRTTAGTTDVSRLHDLWTPLAEELRRPRPFGQPMIAEEEYPRTGSIEVTVIWDKWGGTSDLDRAATIQKAYAEAGRPDVLDRLALAAGYTVAEAAELGMLPFELVPLIRRGDPSDWAERCRLAMNDAGGPLVRGSHGTALRFQSLEQAEACRQELMSRHPDLKDVWSIARIE